ncbi:hypothetical protein KEM48_007553 [Puccinia striiformis f. sp. tritici PST-130]|nr:hypothetical protein KEM48_007553 [Puccinia striiformis f. sp. tritici PST-130]
MGEIGNESVLVLVREDSFSLWLFIISLFSFCIFSLLPGLERANCLSRLVTSVVDIDQQTFYLHILESSFTCAHNTQRLKGQALISRISRQSESDEEAVVPVLIDQ